MKKKFITINVILLLNVNLFGFGGMFNEMQINMSSMGKQVKEKSLSVVEESEEVYDENSYKPKRYSNEDSEDRISDDIIENTTKSVPSNSVYSEERSPLKLQNRFGERQY